MNFDTGYSFDGPNKYGSFGPSSHSAGKEQKENITDIAWIGPPDASHTEATLADDKRPSYVNLISTNKPKIDYNQAAIQPHICTSPNDSRTGKKKRAGEKRLHRKPIFSYSTLITEALQDCEKMTVRQLCIWIANKYPDHFVISDKRWQACVRNTLSQKDHFVKIQSQFRGNYWTLTNELKQKLGASLPVFDNEISEHNTWSSGKFVRIAPKKTKHAAGRSNRASENSRTLDTPNQNIPTKSSSEKLQQIPLSPISLNTNQLHSKHEKQSDFKGSQEFLNFELSSQEFLNFDIGSEGFFNYNPGASSNESNRKQNLSYSENLQNIIESPEQKTAQPSENLSRRETWKTGSSYCSADKDPGQFDLLLGLDFETETHLETWASNL